MAPYKKSEITVDENAFPLLDSNWLRIYSNGSLIHLKPMATYLSFVPINYHSHTMHVDPLFNNSMQARLKLLIKA